MKYAKNKNIQYIIQKYEVLKGEYIKYNINPIQKFILKKGIIKAHFKLNLN